MPYSDPKLRGVRGSAPHLHAFDEDDEMNTDVKALEPEIQREIQARLSSRACFIVLSGANVGEMFRLDSPELVLGRGTQATVRIHDDGVSRRHARVIRDMTGDVHIEDLGSVNGTFVNGEKVGSAMLHDGDKILLGSTTVLKFTYNDELDEKFQQHMYDAALRDGLTRVFNKKYLLDRLTTEIAYARRHRAGLSLILLDLDHFKGINDKHGHLAGDHVLQQMARVGSAVVRTEDVFARYGGEEFAVICRGIPATHARVLAERLRATIAQSEFVYDDVRIPVTASIGVASYPEHDVDDIGGLMLVADEALYAAKRDGRNRVVVR